MKTCGHAIAVAILVSASAIVLALEHLHRRGFVYRDLKDRNVLLDATGQARIADFGLAGDVSHGPIGGKMGTVGYHAPEQLRSKSHKDTEEEEEHHDEDEDDKHTTYTTEPDFWTLGVCAYHWSCGYMPFGPTEEEEGVKKDKEKKKIKKRVNKHIKKGKYDDGQLPSEVAGLGSLCKGLMTVDREQRLGSDAGGFAKLRAHEFFAGFEWDALAAGAGGGQGMPFHARNRGLCICLAGGGHRQLRRGECEGCA